MLVAVALVVAGSAALMGVGGASASGYRTATVASQSVDQTLTEVGVVQPVSQATVAFPVSGTVATVDVAVGDKVGVGQKLATLDTTSLQASVDQSQAALDQAELTLEKALNGESVGGPSGTSGIQTIAFTPGAQRRRRTVPTRSSRPRSALVVDAQQQVDKDLARRAARTGGRASGVRVDLVLGVGVGVGI